MRRRELLAIPAAGMLRGQGARRRKRRRESYFGLHFDLHPGMKDTELGADASEAMVEELLRRVRPDYVQYDCKGHPGVLGYPSEVGPSSPGIVKDSLRIWRDVTAREGVALYVHFSGVWDDEAVKAHPEWARVDASGKRDPQKTSTFGKYVDERMIPQLLEASRKYDLDGVWVDGECWAVGLDYGPEAMEAWRARTGRRTAPKGPEEPAWGEWLEFHREQFRSYLRHYVGVLHRERPGLQVASNWMYTTYVPEKPSIAVDFVSGDYLGNASISTARTEARYLSSVRAATGIAWDLMAWGFAQAATNPVGHVHKPAVQLQQEAAVVLAQGGGFQIYYQPTRRGRLNAGHVRVMEEVARFCRERQSLCEGTETAPEIGVLFSGHSLYSSSGRMFGGWRNFTPCVRGVVDALAEAHFPVDVIPDWRLQEAAREYKLVVVPDWADIGAEAQAAVEAYVRDGGKALVMGAENGLRFAGALGIVAGREAETAAFVEGGELMANVKGKWLSARLREGEEIARRYPAYDPARGGETAAVIRRLGKGTMAGILGPIGSVHAATHNPGVRKFLAGIVERLYEREYVVEGPPTLEVVVRRKAGKRYLHLINTTGMQVAGDYVAVDFVPAVGPVRVKGKGWERVVERVGVYEIVEAG